MGNATHEERVIEDQGASRCNRSHSFHLRGRPFLSSMHSQSIAFQRELVEFIRRKICSPCHAGSSESRTVNRSALMENNGSPSIYSSRYRTNWGVGLASTPSVPFQNLQSQQGS